MNVHVRTVGVMKKFPFRFYTVPVSLRTSFIFCPLCYNSIFIVHRSLFCYRAVCVLFTLSRLIMAMHTLITCSTANASDTFTALLVSSLRDCMNAGSSKRWAVASHR